MNINDAEIAAFDYAKDNFQELNTTLSELRKIQDAFVEGAKWYAMCDRVQTVEKVTERATIREALVEKNEIDKLFSDFDKAEKIVSNDILGRVEILISELRKEKNKIEITLNYINEVLNL